MKPYKEVASALWPDAQTWLVDKHHRDIQNFYVNLFNDYLYERFGRLTPDTRKVMIKELMRNIIQ